ncbi:MAG TPA: DUF354 domain-containing protein [Candidatus Kapabacteria bacterium]|nr:DUF354 domain-containing protein [Candidatus Kapabacteria bacterium]
MPTVQNALSELYEWAKREDFAGHDPHDILSSPFLRGIRTSRSMRVARLVALQLGRRSVVDVRGLLRVPRAENPKALALFLIGLLRAKDLATPDWESDAEHIAQRLLASIRESGGWGYPFPWQSRTHYLREHSPNIVTTAFVGSALLEWNEHAPSPELLEAIHRAASYILSLETEGPAFGYAENDPQIVFNASLLGAEFLLKAGALVSNQTYMELARRAAEFVANAQRTDGGWDYGLEASQRWTDSFHTGFVITSLQSIAERIGDARLGESARRGFEYYRRTFLEPDFAIRYFPNKRYPIDAHALGEAMVTFSTFGDREAAARIAEWAIRHLRSPDGYFYYQRHRLLTNRIPYIRWSNAWIFRGLAAVASTEYRVPSTEYSSPSGSVAARSPKENSILGTRYSVLGTRPLIWIDLENSPHVPFFVPIISELERAGCEVVLTARDFAQTRALVANAGLDARIVGGQYGRTRILKTFGLFLRTARLMRMMRGRSISLAVGHGSRGLLLAARILRIPTLTLYDYEGASVALFNRLSTIVMTPEALPFSALEKLGLTKEKHLTYPGLKEDVYASAFQPHESILRELNLDPERIIITIRPPSRTAHYRSEESFRLYDAIMQLLATRDDVQIVLVPRDRDVAQAYRLAQAKNVIIPRIVVDGLNLLYHSDLMISGGGTMVREAAALGVPAVTIFKGPMGAVDQWLINEGRMVAIDHAEEILPLLRKRTRAAVKNSNTTKQVIVDTILRLANES